ncbi:hypothetical protein [Herbaspirillum sp. ST 5-3]|uniref:hypothetical protein n=1 Tax=Oxalobacteraceae TaxID=75682 RepID=UPI0010A2F3A4|nr:hypothetical protein [Herbaspirillum sp. ST 5-3]
MKKNFTPAQFKKNNFGNNFITIESMLAADFANQTDEQFAKCLDTVPVINKLLIDKSKCDNEQHYKEILLLANTTLSLAMIERRMRIVKNA